MIKENWEHIYKGLFIVDNYGHSLPYVELEKIDDLEERLNDMCININKEEFVKRDEDLTYLFQDDNTPLCFLRIIFNKFIDRNEMGIYSREFQIQSSGEKIPDRIKKLLEERGYERKG